MANEELYNIVMISGDFPPRISGVGDYAWHVSRTINGKKLPVTVITTSGGESDFEIPEGLDVRRVMSKWSFNELIRVVSVINGLSGRTVVNIQYYCPETYGRYLLINFLPLIFRIFRPSIRTVVTMHGFWEQSQLYRLRSIPMLAASHGVIYVDSLNRSLLARFGGTFANRMKYIPIAANILPIPCSSMSRIKWRKELGLNTYDVAISFFGGFGRNKGLEYLIKALHQIIKSTTIPVVMLAIGDFHQESVDDNYESEIHSLIGKLEIQERIKFVSDPKPEMVSRYLHAADMAVYPFINGVGENSGSMLAALAHGLPTVITAGPANNSEFTEKYGVAVVPARNSEMLADEILKVVSSPHRQTDMRRKAIQVSRHFNWEYICKETLHVFDSLRSDTRRE